MLSWDAYMKKVNSVEQTINKKKGEMSCPTFLAKEKEDRDTDTTVNGN